MKLCSDFFNKTFLKFIAVGMANTIFGTAIMLIFYNLLGFGYWISTIANYVFGSVLSYFLNKNFTFKTKDKSFKTILKFIINILLCYLLAYGFAKPAVSLILTSFSKKIQENIAMLAGAAIFIIFNYIGQRFVVFKNTNS